MLYLVESFFSIQGEGKFLGKPSVFFRFGLCNFTCKGFSCKESLEGEDIYGCDTIFAVNKGFKKFWQEINTKEELIFLYNKYTSNISYKPDVVITGGEPILNINNEIFIEFIKFLLNKNIRVTIETNASLNVDFFKYSFFKDICFSMSVKLSNSGEKLKKRLNLANIRAIINNTKNSFFKFVLDSKNIKILEKDIDYIIKNSPSCDVYCMPKGNLTKDLSKEDKSVIDFCLKKGFIYTDRIHIRVYEDKKGV